MAEKEKVFLYVGSDNDTKIDILPPVDGDPTYTVKEFADHSQALFGCGPDTVTAAFAFVGLDCATRAQAVDFVTTFLNRSITN